MFFYRLLFNFIFKSSMVALATLLIFPILVLPYIERVLPATSPYIYYEAISESFKTSVFSTSHIVLLFWNVMVLLLIYLKIKRGLIMDSQQHSEVSFREFLRLLKPHKISISIALIIALIASTLSILQPILLSKIIDNINNTILKKL